jgi:predicted RNase H-like HicB family nuclease
MAGSTKRKSKKRVRKRSGSPAVEVTKDGKWFIARCPAMDLVTQGKTEEEARENMRDMIDEYLSDREPGKEVF